MARRVRTRSRLRRTFRRYAAKAANTIAVAPGPDRWRVAGRVPDRSARHPRPRTGLRRRSAARIRTCTRRTAEQRQIRRQRAVPGPTDCPTATSVTWRSTRPACSASGRHMRRRPAAGTRRDRSWAPIRCSPASGITGQPDQSTDERRPDPGAVRATTAFGTAWTRQVGSAEGSQEPRMDRGGADRAGRRRTGWRVRVAAIARGGAGRRTDAAVRSVGARCRCGHGSAGPGSDRRIRRRTWLSRTGWDDGRRPDAGRAPVDGPGVPLRSCTRTLRRGR